MTIVTNALTDQVVAGAKSLPQLAKDFQSVDPTLAASLESKPLIASKTPWGVLLVTAVTLLSTRYGLGWDTGTDELVAGVALVAMSYLMRILSPTTIRGWFRSPGTPVATPAGTPKVTIVPPPAMAFALLLPLLALAACGTTVTATLPANTPATIANGISDAASVIATGQLVCKAATVAIAVDPSGVPLLAKGNSAQYVQDACASVNGVAVAPPANGVPGTIQVTVPASPPAS